MTARRRPPSVHAPSTSHGKAVSAFGQAVAAGIFARVTALLRTELAAWAAADPGRVDGDPEEWAARVAPVVMSAVPGFIVQRAVVPDFDEDAYLAALDEVYRR